MVCSNERLLEVIDLGYQYLSDFKDKNEQGEQYPLTLLFCEECTLMQLGNVTPREVLYHERYSFKSGVNPAIVDNLKEVVDHAKEYKPNPENWLDIASNDGTLLSFVDESTYTVGIDPLKQFSEEACQNANVVITDFFNKDYFQNTSFDVITSISMFYDIPDPNEFVQDVKSILSEDGIWVIQQNYSPLMLMNNSIDNVSHEHLAYYSLTAMQELLQKYDLEINDVSLSPINGGCFRIVVTNKETYPVSEKVSALLRDEDNLWSDPFLLYDWSVRVKQELHKLNGLVRSIVDSGRNIYVYGASTRGGVIWQAAALTLNELEYVVDRNSDKIGKYMTSIGAKIISEEQMRKVPPDFLLVGPWWFKDQFIEREHDYLNSGGKMIFPLPTVEVV